MGGVRTWIADFWTRYLDTRDSTLTILHSGTRPDPSLDSYIALPRNARLSIECLAGVRVPGSGGRLPSARALARALGACDVCYFDNGYAFQDAVVLNAGRKANVAVASGHHAVIKFGGLHDLAWELLGKRLIRRFAAIHALNANDQRYLQALGARNVQVIPISIDLQTFIPRPREAEFTVLFVGRFHAQKGIDRLARVVRLAQERYGRSMRFNIVGSGPLIGEVERLAALPNVVLRRPSERGTVAALMAAAHVLIVPSRWETFGIVAAEALAAGTPIVTTGVGATRDMAAQGRGYVVEDPDDAAAWCGVLEKIFKRYQSDPSYSPGIAVAARRYAERAFSFEVVASAFDAFFDTAIAAGRG